MMLDTVTIHLTRENAERMMNVALARGELVGNLLTDLLVAIGAALDGSTRPDESERWEAFLYDRRTGWNITGPDRQAYIDRLSSQSPEGGLAAEKLNVLWSVIEPMVYKHKRQEAHGAFTGCLHALAAANPTPSQSGGERLREVEKAAKTMIEILGHIAPRAIEKASHGRTDWFEFSQAYDRLAAALEDEKVGDLLCSKSDGSSEKVGPEGPPEREEAVESSPTPEADGLLRNIAEFRKILSDFSCLDSDDDHFAIYERLRSLNGRLAATRADRVEDTTGTPGSEATDTNTPANPPSADSQNSGVVLEGVIAENAFGCGYLLVDDNDVIFVPRDIPLGPVTVSIVSKEQS